jgi:tetratricopeptide (TPR) repeat protein
MNPTWKKRNTGPTRHQDPDVAIASYLEELRQAEVAGAPTPAAALNGLGDAHLDKGDAVSAIDYYRQAAEVYEREGMHDNAIACCKKIRRHAPGDMDVGLMLGRYYAAKGLRADAIGELETYADRHARSGHRRETIEVLREILRLDPERTGHREQLARHLTEEGRAEEAMAEYRLALERYRAQGDLPGLDRTRTALAALEAPPAEPAPAPTIDPAAPPVPAPTIGPAAPPVPATPPAPTAGPAPFELELEPTSYDEAPAPEPAAVAEPTPAVAVPDEPPPGLLEAPPPITVPESPDEAAAAAEEHAAAGRIEPAARNLAAAALGYRAAGRWQEAVSAYRRLAQLDRASADDFAAWAECARQAGEAHKVLEALAAAARWNLARDDRQAARRAAEEMLLLDPNSSIATDILEQVGTSLPRG